MRLEGKVALITGGGNGIGAALAERFHREGARVAVADLDLPAAERVAQATQGLALRCDVSVEASIREAVAATEERLGPIDLLASNAGVMFSDAPGWMATSQPDAAWDRTWRVNVMAHVWGARAVLPGMIRRGGGTLLNTVSAAGLLNQIGDAAYTATKHAAIGFAESLAITHGDQGIRVSVLCPQAVDTRLYQGQGVDAIAAAASADGVLQPADVAEAVVQGLAEERFLILPHPKVQDYVVRMAADREKWLGAMRRFRRKIFPDDAVMRLE